MTSTLIFGEQLSKNYMIQDEARKSLSGVYSTPLEMNVVSAIKKKPRMKKLLFNGKARRQAPKTVETEVNKNSGDASILISA